MSHCEATHRKAKGGHCELRLDHKGDHRACECFGPGYVFYWPNEAEALNSNVYLASSEIATLLTALQPIKQFFPELEQKLTNLKVVVTREEARRS